MSLEGFAKGVRKLCDTEFAFGVALFGGLIGGGMFGSDLTHESWDNDPTAQTEQVMTDMSQQISDLDLADSKLTILNIEANNDAKKMGDTWKESTQWEEYVVNKARAEAQITTQAKGFFSTVMNSSDITEAGLGKLITDFNEISMDQKVIEFPKSDDTYAFKECQTEIGMTATYQNADDIGACVIDKTESDGAGVLLGVPGLILGVIGLGMLGAGAGGVENLARNRKRKKQQKKPSQN